MGAAAVVLGASGYAGGEVLRLLARHPSISVVAASAESWVGRHAGDAFPHLDGELDLELLPLPQVAGLGDLCFSCLPHGALPHYISDLSADFVIDLADDFRSDPLWTYGLTELSNERGTRVANPGCYPTAALLCLVPLARAGVVDGPVIIDALSGLSGAGRAPRDQLMFAGAAESATAYGPLPHRHVAEIERGLATLGGLETPVSFTPHLVPMARGLLVTARARLTRPLDDDGALTILEAEYVDAPFVHVGPEWPATKHVSGTNNARLSARVDSRTGFVVCSAAIDNLGKGAAGQAVQNANRLLGLDETTGLEAIAAWP